MDASSRFLVTLFLYSSYRTPHHSDGQVFDAFSFQQPPPRSTLVHHDDSAGSTKISDLTDLVINPLEIFTRDFAATKRVSTRPSLCVRRRGVCKSMQFQPGDGRQRDLD
ncbi:conserved hypothetical protein [Trichinella spiralis]|uniref:hypothetical protein n=1 Tax=Trichinella spiralis TaxID=6334 RepID=UPI0001EFD1CC|nr:conserved hypothetical protein [Trichinella spiralis]